MARYFKLVEIDRDSFIEATGDDLIVSKWSMYVRVLGMLLLPIPRQK